MVADGGGRKDVRFAARHGFDVGCCLEA